MRAQDIGEAVGCLLEPAIAEGIDLAVGARMDDRWPRRIGGSPAVADINADIVASRDLPREAAAEFVVISKLGQHRAPQPREIKPPQQPS